MVLVKGDEKSRLFRDRMETLKAFADSNALPDVLATAMKEHLELQAAHDHNSDDQVDRVWRGACLCACVRVCVCVCV
jgi:hypothetical protein